MAFVLIYVIPMTSLIIICKHNTMKQYGCVTLGAQIPKKSDCMKDTFVTYRNLHYTILRLLWVKSLYQQF